ncbi:unnamed protein product [Amoebophrya sp. A120]|nr:unnamed protein product [Amoebophrya sp. A120]|eukprot:GSA120T00014517001.1
MLLFPLQRQRGRVCSSLAFFLVAATTTSALRLLEVKKEDEATFSSQEQRHRKSRTISRTTTSNINKETVVRRIDTGRNSAPRPERTGTGTALLEAGELHKAPASRGRRQQQQTTLLRRTTTRVEVELQKTKLALAPGVVKKTSEDENDIENSCADSTSCAGGGVVLGTSTPEETERTAPGATSESKPALGQHDHRGDDFLMAGRESNSNVVENEVKTLKDDEIGGIGGAGSGGPSCCAGEEEHQSEMTTPEEVEHQTSTTGGQKIHAADLSFPQAPAAVPPGGGTYSSGSSAYPVPGQPASEAVREWQKQHPTCVPISQDVVPAEAINLLLVPAGFFGQDLVDEWPKQARRMNDALVSQYGAVFDAKNNAGLNVFYVTAAALEIDSSDKPACSNGCNGLDRLVCCGTGNTGNTMNDLIPAFKHFAFEHCGYGYYSTLLIIVNTYRYGGAGSQGGATVTLNELGHYVAGHEIGHSLFNLGDEYFYESDVAARGGLYVRDDSKNPNCMTYTTCEATRKELVAALEVDGVTAEEIGTCEPACANQAFYVLPKSFMETNTYAVGVSNERIMCCKWVLLQGRTTTDALPSFCRRFNQNGLEMASYCTGLKEKYGELGFVKHGVNTDIRQPSVQVLQASQQVVAQDQHMDEEEEQEDSGSASAQEVEVPLPPSPSLENQNEHVVEEMNGSHEDVDHASSNIPSLLEIMNTRRAEKQQERARGRRRRARTTTTAGKERHERIQLLEKMNKRKSRFRHRIRNESKRTSSTTTRARRAKRSHTTPAECLGTLSTEERNLQDRDNDLGASLPETYELVFNPVAWQVTVVGEGENKDEPRRTTGNKTTKTSATEQLLEDNLMREQDEIISGAAHQQGDEDEGIRAKKVKAPGQEFNEIFAQTVSCEPKTQLDVGHENEQEVVEDHASTTTPKKCSHGAFPRADVEGDIPCHVDQKTQELVLDTDGVEIVAYAGLIKPRHVVAVSVYRGSTKTATPSTTEQRPPRSGSGRSGDVLLQPRPTPENEDDHHDLAQYHGADKDKDNPASPRGPVAEDIHSQPPRDGALGPRPVAAGSDQSSKTNGTEGNILGTSTSSLTTSSSSTTGTTSGTTRTTANEDFSDTSPLLRSSFYSRTICYFKYELLEVPPAHPGVSTSSKRKINRNKNYGEDSSRRSTFPAHEEVRINMTSTQLWH